MKKGLCMGLVLSTLASFTLGCMGTAPRPVESFQYGDEKKSCGILQAEVSECETKIETLHQKRKNKIGGNVVLGLAGALVFWPALFFMDTKSDEGVEIDALMKRRKLLATMAMEKECEWCVGKDLSETALMDRIDKDWSSQGQQAAHSGEAQNSSMSSMGSR